MQNREQSSRSLKARPSPSGNWIYSHVVIVLELVLLSFSLIPVEHKVAKKREREENEVNDILEPGQTRVAYNNNNNHKREKKKRRSDMLYRTDEARCANFRRDLEGSLS